MLQRFLFPFLVGALLLAVACRMPDYTPRGYLYSYGINSYNAIQVTDGQGERWTLGNLTNPVNDATAVYELLRRQGYETRLRLDGGITWPGGQTAAPATLEQLEMDIAEAAELAGPLDTIVFYFAGHGARLRAAEGEEVLEHPNPLWIPAFTEPDPVPTYPGERLVDWFFLYADNSTVPYSALGNHFFSDQTLALLLESIEQGKIVVIFDSCHSGGFIGDTHYSDPWLDPVYADPIDGYRRPRFSELFASWNRSLSSYNIRADIAVVLAASGRFELAADDYLPDPGHGPFTYFLLRSANQGDLNRDGYVSIAEIYEYTARELRGAGYEYHPRITASAVDFIIFKTEQ